MAHGRTAGATDERNSLKIQGLGKVRVPLPHVGVVPEGHDQLPRVIPQIQQEQPQNITSFQDSAATIEAASVLTFFKVGLFKRGN